MLSNCRHFVRQLSEGQTTTTRFKFAVRLAFVVAAVFLCYQFQWQWLRFATSEVNRLLDALAGIHLQRISSDVVALNGATFRYDIACTFADVWCGAIPLLWDFKPSVRRNVAFVAAFTLALFALNVVRLSAADIL